MKKIFLLYAMTFFSLQLSYAQPGELDSSFGINGIVTTSSTSGPQTIIAIQTNGKILFGDVTLSRYNTDGSLDSTFAIVNLSVMAIAIQSDGKIVVASRGTEFVCLSRYNKDGSIDSSFDKDGIKATAFHIVSYEEGNDGSVAIQNDGKILLSSVYGLARYNTDGSNDIDLFPKFSFAIASIAIQNDGKIVVAGFNGSFALGRYNKDGSIDNSFSEDGMQTTKIGFQSFAVSAAIQGDGKIVLAGSDEDSSNYNFALARYKSDGTLDSSFSDDGIQTTDFGFYDVAHSVAIQSDGKIVAAGYSTTNFTASNFALARYNSDGTPDHTFSEDGKQITTVGTKGSFIYNIAISNKKLYAAGRINTAAGLLARYQLYDNEVTRVRISNPYDNESFIAPANITINAVADPFTGGSISKVDFYNDTTLLSTDNASPYTYTWKNVPVGNYSLTVKATDNTGKVTTSYVIHISVIHKAPIVNITIPRDNAIYQAPATILITATATDNDPDGTINKVEFYNGTSLLHTETIAPYTYTWKNVAAGNYTLIAKATNNTGDVTTSSAVKISVISNKKPSVSIISLVNNQTFAAPATISLRAFAKDPDGTISKVQFYNGTTLLKTEFYSPYTYKWKDVPAGSYSITAKAKDDWGAVTTSAAVNISVVANKAPSVNITNPVNYESFTSPASIPLIASAKDPDGTISKVEFYNGTTLIATQYFTPYTSTWKDVPAGTYTLTAKAIDNLGLPATSEPVTITVESLNTLIVKNKPSSANNKRGLNDASSLKLYPNPVNNTLNISTAGFEQNKPTTLSVISVSGIILKKMQMNSLSQPISLNVTSLAKGVYTLKVASGNKVVSKLFIKL